LARPDLKPSYLILEGWVHGYRSGEKTMAGIGEGGMAGEP